MEPSSGDSGTPATVPAAPAFDEGAAPPAPAAMAAPPGDVRFDVTPQDAEIQADGFYAGIVDDFNGSVEMPVIVDHGQREPADPLEVGVGRSVGGFPYGHEDHLSGPNQSAFHFPASYSRCVRTCRT